MIARRSLLLASPLLLWRPFTNIGALDAEGNRRYRAYFTADFLWHVALTAELARADMPPRNPYLVRRFLHATLQNVRYGKLLRDLGKIARFALIALRRGARNYLQIGNASQPRQDLLPNTISQVGVIRIGTEVFKGKYGNALLWCSC